MTEVSDAGLIPPTPQQHLVSCSVRVVNLYLVNESSRTNNYDNHHDESKTTTHIYNKRPGGEEPWAPNNITENVERKKNTS